MSDALLTRAQIEEEFNISVAKLERWSARRDGCGCPLLHGEPLHSVVRDGLICYRRRDIEAVVRQCEEAARSSVISKDGVEWLRGTLAAERWNFSLPSLVGWRTNGCPWLSEKRRPQTWEVLILQRRAGSKGSFRLRHYYLATDLALIAAKRAEAGKLPGWATALEIATDPRYGCSAWLLRKWSGRRKSMRKKKPPRFQCLGNRYLSSRHAQRGVGKGARQVVEYSLDDLDRIAEARVSGLDPALWVAAGDAVTEYGFKRPTLTAWKKSGCPALGGRRLVCQTASKPDKHGKCQTTDFFRRDELEEIRRHNRHKAHVEPYEDADGKWWPFNEAARQCGCRPGNFVAWLKRPCRFLGRILNSKFVPRHGPSVKNGRRRVVHDDDVRAIRNARNGIAATPASAILHVENIHAENLSVASVTAGKLKIATPAPPTEVRPRWDGTILWFGEIELRSYQKKAAPEQAAILETLEKAGWPSHRVQLHESCWLTLHVTLNNINEKIKDRIIRLQAAGDGKSVIWSKNKEG